MSAPTPAAPPAVGPPGAPAGAALAEHLSALPLIDHHAHGFWEHTADRRALENGLNEANTEPLADFDSGFDTQLGFAVRAHCAPLLGLPAHAEPDAYWQRRAALGDAEVARRLLPAAGVSHWLVDTGFAAGTAGLDAMAAASGGRVLEIVRLETLAEEAVALSGDYPQVFTDLLAERAATAVGTKSVLAYRGGFRGDLGDPPAAEVRAAAARWRATGAGRLTDRVLVRFGLHRALALGKPLQLHTGLGDRDADLAAANPILLTDFLRSSGDTPVLLLHCYPYEREAGYLAQAFNNVHIDGGLAVNHLGAASVGLLARLLELAPLRKVLYSSDAYGPPELHYLGARLWRAGMSAVLGGFVEAGQWSLPDALRVAELIAHRTARRVYDLG